MTKLEAVLRRSCLGALGVLFVSGCSAAPAEEAAAPSELTGDPPAAGVPVRPDRPASEVPSQSIFGLKSPGSRVPTGTKVRLDGPTIQVTARSADTLWIQEAGGSGACEAGDAAVAYRAIAVRPKVDPFRFARGQRVDVVGVIADEDGRRIIADAAVEAIGEPGEPYNAHCERDGAALASDALEGVLIVTAGTTEDTLPPDAFGGWSLATCFAKGAAPLEVGADMAAHDEWTRGWHWVAGIMVRRGGSFRLEPRDPTDILQRRSSDVCL